MSIDVNKPSLPLLQTLFPSDILEKCEKAPDPAAGQPISSTLRLTIKVMVAALHVFTERDFAALTPLLDCSISHVHGFLLYTLTTDQDFVSQATYLRENLPNKQIPLNQEIVFERFKQIKISQKMAFLFCSCLLNALQKATRSNGDLKYETQDPFLYLIKFLKPSHQYLISFIEKKTTEISLSLLQAEAELIRPCAGKDVIKKMISPVDGKICLFYQHEAIFQRLFEKEGIVCLKVSEQKRCIPHRYFFEADFGDSFLNPSRIDPKTPCLVFEGAMPCECTQELFENLIQNEIGLHNLINASAAREPLQWDESIPDQIKDEEATTLFFKKVARFQDHERKNLPLFTLNRIYCSSLAQEEDC